MRAGAKLFALGQDCPAFDRCAYRLDIQADPELRALYLDAEPADGYFRDQCVFSADISIEDTMQVQVRYQAYR